MKALMMPLLKLQDDFITHIVNVLMERQRKSFLFTMTEVDK